MKHVAIKLTIAIGTIASCLSLFEVEPTRAALIRYDFVVEIPTGPFGDYPLTGSKGNGFFTFDDSASPVPDMSFVNYYRINELSFDFLGNTFTAEDDVGLPQEPEIPYPTVGFRDNALLGLNYAVTSTSSTDPGFFFADVAVPFVAGRGAIAQRLGYRDGNDPVTSKSLSIAPEGDPGLSDGQVTYTQTSTSVPESSCATGLVAIGILGNCLVLRLRRRRKSTAKQLEQV